MQGWAIVEVENWISVYFGPFLLARMLRQVSLDVFDFLSNWFKRELIIHLVDIHWFSFCSVLQMSGFFSQTKISLHRVG